MLVISNSPCARPILKLLVRLHPKYCTLLGPITITKNGCNPLYLDLKLHNIGIIVLLREEVGKKLRLLKYSTRARMLGVRFHS